MLHSLITNGKKRKKLSYIIVRIIEDGNIIKNILLSSGNIFVCLNALYVNDSFPELYSYTEESEFKFNREAFEKTLFSQGKAMLEKGVLFVVH